MVVVGTIRKVLPERGYGFIETEPPGQDVFFHARTMQRGTHISSLHIGDKVSFVMEQHEGRLRAKNVRVIPVDELAQSDF